MDYKCFKCDINQMKKVSSFMDLDEKIENLLIDTTKEYLNKCDMCKTNPEIMGEIWGEISNIINTDNPYKEIKSYYNNLLLSLEADLEKRIEDSKDSNNEALRIAIVSNLIDFAAKHTFNETTIRDMIFKSKEINLQIDDSEELFENVKNSKTILYLGDNCGEIVSDKVFIKRLKLINPNSKFIYAVRGKSIVNDVTIEDAKEVNIGEIATVISNGDGSLGTVLERTSSEFKDIFEKADMVISKGQGNYEGLQNVNKRNLYFLFMAKCNLVADPLKVKTMSTVCMKKSN